MSDRKQKAFDGRAYASRLPQAPGVYLMRDADEQALYVGKARNLRKRVASYFTKSDHSPRITRMLQKVAQMEISLTRTESDALLLENEWIKSLKPRYNIQLRDDKSYPFLHLTGHAFPRVAFHRGARSTEGEYYGPYPSAGSVRRSIQLIQRLFRLRNCEDSFFEHRSRPCLQYQIERCTAPCVGYIDEPAYAARVQQARWFLEGRSQEVIDALVSEMESASEALEFERAADLRDQIRTLKKMQAQQFVAGSKTDTDIIAAAEQGGAVGLQVLSFRGGRNIGQRSYFPVNANGSRLEEVVDAFIGQFYQKRRPPESLVVSHAPENLDILESALSEAAGRSVDIQPNPRGERRRWLQQTRENAHNALSLKLASQASLARQFDALVTCLELDQVPERLECFDVSHVSGQQTVASCVVFDQNGPVKSQYRRFNLTGITPGDDYAGMHQVLTRRYTRQKREDAVLPDLLVVDGGKGQLNQALEVLEELGIADQMTVIGIAKGPSRRAGHEEWLVDDGRSLQPGPDSPASHLMQRIRDEAHRFAITGHRGRRQKKARESSLEAIPGVGAKRRKALLSHFGGLRGVEGAGIAELATVPGISTQMAETIYRHLHAV